MVIRICSGAFLFQEFITYFVFAVKKEVLQKFAELSIRDQNELAEKQALKAVAGKVVTTKEALFNVAYYPTEKVRWI